MSIDARWMQTGVDALHAMLKVEPQLQRQMIEFLFNEGFWDGKKLSWDAAVARWNACLNPGQNQFFKLGELWALAKRFERYQLFDALEADLGREVRVIPTEARRQALLERIAEAMEHANAVAERDYEALRQLDGGNAEADSRIHPAMHGLGARFDLDDTLRMPCARVGLGPNSVISPGLGIVWNGNPIVEDDDIGGEGGF